MGRGNAFDAGGAGPRRACPFLATLRCRCMCMGGLSSTCAWLTPASACWLQEEFEEVIGDYEGFKFEARAPQESTFVAQK